MESRHGSTTGSRSWISTGWVVSANAASTACARLERLHHATEAYVPVHSLQFCVHGVHLAAYSQQQASQVATDNMLPV